jgi:prepilin-type N-terminal cleavage/methylation domain-containing protein
MNANQRHQEGYSLAEMLTVIAIIGVLALVTVPSFMTFYQSNKMKASMRTFTTDLRSVRQLAITRGRQTLLTFGTGPTQRSYNWWVGDRPFNSTTWTPMTGPNSNPPRATRVLDDVVYFPANSAPTPQTFTDILNCSSGTNCLAVPPAAGDTLIDVIFLPDGTSLLPGNASSATITVKTDMRIPKSQYTVTISPSGRVLAQ